MKYKVIYLLILLSLIYTTIAYAYFSTDNYSNEFRINPVSNHHTSLNDNVFYLYDNYFYKHKNSVVTKKVKGFVAVDQIMINIPLKILSKKSIYPEDSIDRLLLANLRINELVSEYSDLQKKSQLMLNNNNGAGTRPGTGTNHSDKTKNRLESIEYEKERISEKILNITRLSEVSKVDILSKETFPVEFDVDADNRHISSLNMATDGTDSSKTGESSLDLRKIDSDTGRQIFMQKENSELPWIFSLFLKILNYMLANRVEVILYMVFIAVAGYVISLQIRR